jgi:hypothetical protein
MAARYILLAMPEEEGFHDRAERSPSFAIDLDIHPLAGRIGAEIGNVRLAGNLPEPPLPQSRRRWRNTR